MRKLPITVITIGFLAMLVAWLWPNGDNNDPVFDANNEPVSEASQTQLKGQLPSPSVGRSETTQQQAIDIGQANLANNKADLWVGSVVAERPPLDEQQDAVLKMRFSEANQKLNQGALDQAVQVYSNLISSYPNFVEPYVNLASVQAQQGKLDDARQTLLKATQANQSTKVLFDSINKLHSALAAQAYRRALETQSSTSITANLPKVNVLATDFELTQHVSSLTARLAEEKARQQNEMSSNGSALKSARAELAVATDTIKDLKSSHQESLKKLTLKLNDAEERLALSDKQLNNLRQESSKIENDLIAKLRIELRDIESTLRSSQTKSDELLKLNKDLSRQLESSKASLAIAQAATKSIDSQISTIKPDPDLVAPPKPISINNSERQSAINLVKNWASAWSSQDVNAYLNFYRDNYTSSPNLTHQQWVEQRQVRLTNKSFINVGVRDFSVRRNNNGFSVAFTQHYRSNTLDDTIRKEITFITTDQNWSNAKINSEKIISR